MPLPKIELNQIAAMMLLGGSAILGVCASASIRLTRSIQPESGAFVSENLTWPPLLGVGMIALSIFVSRRSDPSPSIRRVLTMSALATVFWAGLFEAAIWMKTH